MRAVFLGKVIGLNVLALKLWEYASCNILSLNTPVTDELLVIRLVNLLGYVVSVDYRL